MIHLSDVGNVFLSPTDFCLEGSTPDGGALCYVLRTGAYSFQGDLRRMIDFGSHGIREESKDAGVFFPLDAAVLLGGAYVRA